VCLSRVCVPAGAALLWLAATTLVRSRKPGRLRYVRRAAWVALDELASRISPRALFLIHAQDGGGGEDLTPDYFAAAGEPKTIWMVPEGEHTAAIVEQPEEYARRVGDFFAQKLLPS